jgi:hypothetical protein
MGFGLPSKRAHDARVARARLTVLAPAPQKSFRDAENSTKALAGNMFPIVHTAHAFDPTAQQAAQ